MSTNKVKVWDPFIRIFHWSLVALFVITYLTGEDENVLHIYAGYAIGTLIVARIVWGFVGSQHARFSDFIRPPSEVVSYLKSMMGGKPSHFNGHNPAGGYMVVALLVMITITTVTGLKVYGEEGNGPLAGNTTVTVISAASADDDEHERRESGVLENDEHGSSESAEKFWEEIHEVAANLTVLLIFLHILGVIVASRIHKENLVKAMVTGVKDSLD